MVQNIIIPSGPSIVFDPTVEEDDEDLGLTAEQVQHEGKTAGAAIRRSDFYVAYMPVDLMFVDNYGRSVSEQQVNRMITAGWTEDRAGVIALSQRSDGRYAIMDGNHRVQVARKLYVAELLARVRIGLTYREEAILFAYLNTVNRPTALDRFNAHYEGGVEYAVSITSILHRYGLRMAKAHNSGHIVSAAAALTRLYNEQGPEGVEQVVGIIYETWGYERRAWVTGIIDGLRTFWMRYHRKVDKPSLIKNLKRVTPERILAEAGVTAKILRDKPGALVGRWVLAYYNSGRRSGRLDEWVTNPGRVPNMPGRVPVKDRDYGGSSQVRRRQGG